MVKESYIDSSLIEVWQIFDSHDSPVQLVQRPIWLKLIQTCAMLIRITKGQPHYSAIFGVHGNRPCYL